MDPERLAMSLEDCRSRLSEADSPVLSNKISRLEQDYQSLLSAVAGKGKVITELKAQNAALGAENEQLREKVGALERQLKTLQEDAQTLNERIDFLSAETSAYQQTAQKGKPSDSLREKLKRAETTVDELTKEKAKWTFQKSEKSQLLRSNSQLRQQAADIQKQFESFRDQLLAARQLRQRWYSLFLCRVISGRIRTEKHRAWCRLAFATHAHEHVSERESSDYLREKLDELKVRHRNLFSFVLRLLAGKSGARVELCRCGVPPDWLEMLFGSIAQMAMVREIDLSRNRVGDAVIPHIVALEVSGQHLSHLNLAHIELSSQGVSTLLECMQTSTVLEALDISGNSVLISELIAFIRNAQALRQLGAAEIGLQHPSDLKSLAEALAVSPITILDISGNPIPSIRLKSLLAALAAKPWQQLALSRLELTDTHTEGLCQLVRQSKEIQALEIANARLSQAGMTEVVEALAGCACLEKVDLSGTQASVSEVCGLLEACPGLLELHIKDVHMSEDDFSRLGTAVSRATNLQVCLVDPPKPTR